ncbi:hypothetical protein HZA87_01700 [Candidatus Uhrbacteria bacterium]|nr:hypothetical protein [Candidatus Uhrbacteria bacterium]
MPPKKAALPDLWPCDLKRVLEGQGSPRDHTGDTWEAIMHGLGEYAQATGVSFDDPDDLIPSTFDFVAERLSPYVQLPIELTVMDAGDRVRPREDVFRVIWRRSSYEDRKAVGTIFGIECSRTLDLSQPIRMARDRIHVRDPGTDQIMATLDPRRNILWIYFQKVETYISDAQEWANTYLGLFDALVGRVIPLMKEPQIPAEQWLQERRQARRTALELVYKACRIHGIVFASGDLEKLDELKESLEKGDEVVRLASEVECLGRVAQALGELVEQFQQRTAADCEKIMKRPDVVSLRVWGSILVLVVLKLESMWMIVINREKASDPIRWYKSVGSKCHPFAPSHYRMLIPLVGLLGKGEWGMLLTTAIAAIGTSRIQPLHHVTGVGT